MEETVESTMDLSTRHILLGVSGSIAAYKSAILVRSLREQGADVRVIMTQGAQHFITPLTMQSLSANPVETQAFDGEGDSGMKHIDLARWADILLIAPATANVIAKLANGIADDLLTMTYLASDKPCALAPAMNRQMWQHPSTTENTARLKRNGVHILGPASGDQACGDTGEGRMLEPEDIVTALPDIFMGGGLAKHKVVITAGPTLEPIDPVRYISNHSSGKMGFALADAAAVLGAEVVLISGPVGLETPPRVQRINVTTADEMSKAALLQAQDADIFIGCAAVSDYRAVSPAAHKIKRDSPHIQIELTANTDIIKAVSNSASPPFMVGFAAETEKLESNAKVKLLEKKLDMICANLVGAADVGFHSDFNQVTAYWRGGHKVFAKESKQSLAQQLMQLIEEHFSEYQEQDSERVRKEDTA